MLNGRTFLAIVPARGGSKRLPRKNVLDLAGKPLILWTIEAAIQCEYIDKIVISSDDDEILAVAEAYDTTPLKRPRKLASDTATTFDAIEHAIRHHEGFDYIVLLQATSPLRTAQHISEAIELLEAKKADAVISVCEMEHSPLWSNTLPEDGSMVSFLSRDIVNKRSQDLTQYYRLNGAIYICKTQQLLKESTFFIKEHIYAYGMSRKSSIDIDEEIEFQVANLLLQTTI